MATGRVLVGTQPAASLHRRSTVSDVAETTATYMTSSTTEMHVSGLKTGIESRSTMQGTMTITTLSTTNLTCNLLQMEDMSQQVSRLIPET
jgi:hypothetical protein